MGEKNQTIRIELRETSYMLKEVVVYAAASNEDPAYRIMRKAIAHAPYYRYQIKEYTSEEKFQPVFGLYLHSGRHLERIYCRSRRKRTGYHNAFLEGGYSVGFLGLGRVGIFTGFTDKKFDRFGVRLSYPLWSIIEKP